jgi:hypothetical protein
MYGGCVYYLQYLQGWESRMERRIGKEKRRNGKRRHEDAREKFSAG